ncbi:CGNR zinc finger domain-containing protein [Actinacidiphila acididurans]|nr:CGNR zinc finger domain-containing protein [Actinacidiphila acididurans]
MKTRAPLLLGEPLPVELMNTIWADRDGVYDSLAEPGGTEAWLRAVATRVDLTAGDGPADLLAEDTEHLARPLARLRDALRVLAAEVTGDPRPTASPTAEFDAAVATVNEAAGAVPRWSVLAWVAGASPTRLTRSGGPTAAAVISAIAEEAIAVFAHGDRLRLRACLAPGCVRYFVKDHPRREWCSPACGNRVRAARHYQRHRHSPV